jgi:hypothetical protein
MVPRGEWDAMRAEVAELRRSMPRSPTPVLSQSQSDGEGRTDRRGLLKRGAMLAAAAAAGGTALVAAQASPAAATTGTMQFGISNDAGTAQTTLTSTDANITLEVRNTGSGFALYADDNGAGTNSPLGSQVLNFNSTASAAAFGTYGLGPSITASNGLYLNAASVISADTVGTGNAIDGLINNTASAATALHGVTNGTGSAVVGQITNASSSSVAVGGVTNGTGAAFGGLAVGAGPAISGLAWGTGSAVVAQIAIPSNSQPAVIASTVGTGSAIHGTGTGTGSRGGVFGGVAAQVQLTPGSGSTHPTSGTVGDLFVDSTGRLWFCKATGSPATWTQVA